MKNKMKIFTLEDHLKKSLKDPEFKKAWEESEVEYQLMLQLIKERLKRKLSQRALAKKVGTSQSVIARIEGMNANPSLFLLKRIAQALNAKLTVSLS